MKWLFSGSLSSLVFVTNNVFLISCRRTGRILLQAFLGTNSYNPTDHNELILVRYILM